MHFKENMKKRRRHTPLQFKTRREVALLYFSEKTPVNAVNCLRRWIMTDAELLEKLLKANYHPRSRYFSSRQVEILRRYL